MDTILVVPGLRGSGPTHWQTWFESVVPGTRRVEQADWALPSLAVWTEPVREAILAAAEPVWIVAHSFGCLAAVAAATIDHERVRGALLVAPADPSKFHLPAHCLDQTLPFPSMVVASENDPWVGLESAARLAVRWGSRLVNIGRAGHINVDSGFGPWPGGLELFNSLRRQSLETSTLIPPACANFGRARPLATLPA
jgi:predicted alpha/beta hydrolase family esterase